MADRVCTLETLLLRPLCRKEGFSRLFGYGALLPLKKNLLTPSKKRAK
ncbi:hypothetical protein [Photorhabdus temperata]|nr:hypothetical protein [Photorhabdus temperata]